MQGSNSRFYFPIDVEKIEDTAKTLGHLVLTGHLQMLPEFGAVAKCEGCFPAVKRTENRESAVEHLE